MNPGRVALNSARKWISILLQARVLADDYGSVEREGARARGFIGAVGVSFLTAV